VLPLTNGASFVDGARSVTVAGTAYRANRCVVSLESSAADTFASQLSQPRLVPHFRLRDGVLLADRPDFQSSQSFGRAPVSMHAGGGGGIGSIYFGVGPVYLPQPLQITYFTLEPTFAVAIDLSRPVPPGPPCDHIELVLERTTYAGRLTRTLELADFRMDDQASAR